MKNAIILQTRLLTFAGNLAGTTARNQVQAMELGSTCDLGFHLGGGEDECHPLCARAGELRTTKDRTWIQRH